MSIRAIHMQNIAQGIKNHEYRKYLLPKSVKRIWFYTSAPVSQVCYVALIGPGRQPGEVPEDGGLGNDDFNGGKKVSKYGYEIEKLWKLKCPISLAFARKRGYLKGPPQKYNWAPPMLIQDYPLKNKECVIGEVQKEKNENGRVDLGDLTNDKSGNRGEFNDAVAEVVHVNISRKRVTTEPCSDEERTTKKHKGSSE
eukprot:IDg8886t1